MRLVDGEQRHAVPACHIEKRRVIETLWRDVEQRELSAGGLGEDLAALLCAERAIEARGGHAGLTKCRHLV